MRILTAAAATVAATLLAGTAASAAIVGFSPNADFSDMDYTVDLGDGNTYTFSNGGPGGFFGTDVPAIATTGTATVASLGPPFNAEPEPTTYFTDSRRPFIDETLLAIFAGYDQPADVEGAVTDAYLALRFEREEGFHYAYARVAGTTLLEFGFNDVAGEGLRAGAEPDIAFDVPEPGMIGLLGLAVLGLGAARRRSARAEG